MASGVLGMDRVRGGDSVLNCFGVASAGVGEVTGKKMIKFAPSDDLS